MSPLDHQGPNNVIKRNHSQRRTALARVPHPQSLVDDPPRAAARPSPGPRRPSAPKPCLPRALNAAPPDKSQTRTLVSRAAREAKSARRRVFENSQHRTSPVCRSPRLPLEYDQCLAARNRVKDAHFPGSSQPQAIRNSPVAGSAKTASAYTPANVDHDQRFTTRDRVSTTRTFPHVTDHKRAAARPSPGP